MTNPIIYTKYSLVFLGRDLKPLGGFTNICQYQDLEALKKVSNLQVKFDLEVQREYLLDDDELIVGLDVGVDSRGDVNNIRFIVVKSLSA